MKTFLIPSFRLTLGGSGFGGSEIPNKRFMLLLGELGGCWWHGADRKPLREEMFKKPLQAPRQNQAKGSQKRQIKLNILKCFPTLQSDDLDALIPNKGDFVVSNFPGSRTVVYLQDKEPVFFDLENRGKVIIPTGTHFSQSH